MFTSAILGVVVSKGSFSVAAEFLLLPSSLFPELVMAGGGLAFGFRVGSRGGIYFHSCSIFLLSRGSQIVCCSAGDYGWFRYLCCCSELLQGCRLTCGWMKMVGVVLMMASPPYVLVDGGTFGNPSFVCCWFWILLLSSNHSTTLVFSCLCSVPENLSCCAARIGTRFASSLGVLLSTSLLSPTSFWCDPDMRVVQGLLDLRV